MRSIRSGCLPVYQPCCSLLPTCFSASDFEPGLPALTVVAYGFAISALIWVIVLPPRIVDVDTGVWLQLGWVGVMGTAVPFVLMVTALGRADSGTVGVVATLEPVVAAISAWIFLSQSLTAIQVIGGLMVVIAIGTIQMTIAPRVPVQM